MKIVVDAERKTILGAALFRHRVLRGDPLDCGHPVRESAVHGDSARHAYLSHCERIDTDAARRVKATRVSALAFATHRAQKGILDDRTFRRRERLVTNGGGGLSRLGNYDR